MHGGVVHDGHIWVVGVENRTPDDVWKSKDGVNWELVAARVPPWQERGNQMVTVFDGSIWVMGGQAGAASQSSFLEELKAGRRQATMVGGGSRSRMSEIGLGRERSSPNANLHLVVPWASSLSMPLGEVRSKTSKTPVTVSLAGVGVRHKVRF